MPLTPRPTADPRSVIEGDRYRITVLTDGLVRLEYAEDGVFEDRASMLALHRDLPVPDFRVTDHGTHLEIRTDRCRLTYDKGPFTTSGLSVAVLGGVSIYHSIWRYGQDGPNLGGTVRTLDHADGEVPLEPGIVAREGYAVLDDSRSLLLTDDGWVAPRDGSRTDLYVFAYGHDYTEAVRAFHALSGPVPLLPRWALGNWWSRYHRYTDDEYLALMERFEAEGLPFSVAVLDMDWHVVDIDAKKYGSGWTGYTWNHELFPDPPAFLDRLHEHGLRVTLNVHPADGVRAHEASYARMCQALGRDPSSGDPIVFDAADRAFLTAYFDVLHRGLEADGVDFWWVDWQSGPYSRVAGIDPLWMLNHFHFLDNARDGRRPLTFSRYAGPGSHRYPIGFSGDTVISWETLAFQPRFTATAANIGYGWWSHDIGGHMLGAKDDELATRWVQFGVFSPVMRLHSSSNPFTTKEPWSFGREHQDAQTAFLRLRHRLIPYLHTMNHRAAAEGIAPLRPLYHGWPEAPEAYGHPDQYTFGSQLLVAPVTTPRDASTRLGTVPVWLPPGTWVDVLSDTVYTGDRETEMHRDIATIPVLAPAGAIVPLDGAEVPANGGYLPEHLEVLVIVGEDGAFTLVEDDGSADGGEKPARTPLTYDQATGVFTIGAPQGPTEFLPQHRSWTVTFPCLQRTDEAAGRAVTLDGEHADADFTHRDGRVSIRVDAVPLGTTVRVHLGARPALAPNDIRSRLFTRLDAVQCAYELKSRILDIALSDKPLHVRLSHLVALRLEAPLHSAVAEILLADAGTTTAVSPEGNGSKHA
ncbi:TIM-barrel domain-containing protein [Streptomyces sp. NPDC059785]|uniref:glycoside hydrolase family 31 protein n=1 Tax=Streptomyces sp. NPDC059785 TaxID=3346945 RepID=UPI003657D7DE